MISKLFSVLAVISYLMVPASGCEYKQLEAEAEALSNQIFCKSALTEPKITKNLYFLYDEQLVDASYRDPDVFKKLLAVKEAEIPDGMFLAFVELCKQAYDHQQNPRSKTALHMLFERTGTKFQRLYKLREKKSAEELQYSSETLKAMSEAADKFFSMDKSGVRDFNGMDPIGTH